MYYVYKLRMKRMGNRKIVNLGLGYISTEKCLRYPDIEKGEGIHGDDQNKVTYKHNVHTNPRRAVAGECIMCAKFVDAAESTRGTESPMV